MEWSSVEVLAKTKTFPNSSRYQAELYMDLVNEGTLFALCSVLEILQKTNPIYSSK